ncbi:MAG: DUF5132 domain-containing protein [Geitlerinemataceae cyanobacterium]
MEFGPLLFAFLLGGLVFAPVVNAIDGVFGNAIARATRGLAKSTIVMSLGLAEKAKVASAELGEAFQDLVSEARAVREARSSQPETPPPTEVEIDTE